MIIIPIDNDVERLTECRHGYVWLNNPKPSWLPLQLSVPWCSAPPCRHIPHGRPAEISTGQASRVHEENDVCRDVEVLNFTELTTLYVYCMSCQEGEVIRWHIRQHSIEHLIIYVSCGPHHLFCQKVVKIQNNTHTTIYIQNKIHTATLSFYVYSQGRLLPDGDGYLDIPIKVWIIWIKQPKYSKTCITKPSICSESRQF